MATTVSNSYDWEQLYATLQNDIQLPGTYCIQNTGSQLIYRDLVVNLDDMLTEINKGPSRPVMIFVYADVVCMPSERNWLLSDIGLFIAACRIIANSGTFFQLDYRETTNNANLIIYASKIEGVLKATTFKSTDPKQNPDVYDLSHFDGLGVQIVRLNGAILRKNLTYPTRFKELLVIVVSYLYMLIGGEPINGFML